MRRDQIIRIRVPVLNAWSPVLRYKPVRPRSSDSYFRDHAEELKLVEPASALIKFQFPLLVALLDLGTDFLISRQLRELEEQLDGLQEHGAIPLYDQLNETIYQFAIRIATSDVGIQVGLPHPQPYPTDVGGQSTSTDSHEGPV